MSGKEDEGFGILDAIVQIKREILQLQAEEKKGDMPSMFFIEGGELELKLVAKREAKGEAKGKGKFRFFVVDAEASASGSLSITKEEIQTLKLKFSSITSSKPGGDSAIGWGLDDKPKPVIATPVLETKNLPTGKKKGK